MITGTHQINEDKITINRDHILITQVPSDNRDHITIDRARITINDDHIAITRIAWSTRLHLKNRNRIIITGSAS